MKTFKALYKEEDGYSTLNIYMDNKGKLGTQIAELNEDLIDAPLHEKIENLLGKLLYYIQGDKRTAELFSNSKFEIDYRDPDTGRVEKYTVANDHLVTEFGKVFIELYCKGTTVTTYKFLFSEEDGVNKLQIFMTNKMTPVKDMGCISEKNISYSLSEKIDRLLIKFLETVEKGKRAEVLFKDCEIKIWYKNKLTGAEVPYIIQDKKLAARFEANTLHLI